MKISIYVILFVSISFSFFGCASGNFTYIPSNQPAFVKNSIDVDKSKDSTWNQLIAGLSSGFFVINNMDRESGFLNLSYAGDPEKYVDGGELNYTMSNLRGERTYRFPASRASAQYEAMVGSNLCGFLRQLDLDGRINILLSELAPSRTRITVNIRYILTLKVTGQSVTGQIVAPYQETFSFNSGQSTKSNAGTEYRSKGILEQTILEIFK